MTWLSTSPDTVALLPVVLPLACVLLSWELWLVLVLPLVLPLVWVLFSSEDPAALSSAVFPLGVPLPEPDALPERLVRPEVVALPDAEPLGAADAITVRSEDVVRSDDVERSEDVLEPGVGTPEVAPVAPPLATVGAVELSGCSVESAPVEAVLEPDNEPDSDPVLDDRDGVVEPDNELSLRAVAVSDDEPPMTIR